MENFRNLKAALWWALCTGAAAACLAFGPASPGLAAPVTAQENALNRINLAGRQRMLTQELTRDACFVIGDIESQRFAAKAIVSVQRFDATLTGLRNGDENLRLLPETDPQILAALDEVDELWRELGPAAQQIAARDLHSVPMRQLILLNLKTLVRMNKAVSLIQERYSSDEVLPELAKTINLAGRQRMLSQKAAKEVCFISIGLTPTDNRASLRQTMEAFEASLKQLREGSPADGVLAPPNSGLKHQLDQVDQVWRDFAALLIEAMENPLLDQGRKVKLANISDQILMEMNLAVTMYLQ